MWVETCMISTKLNLLDILKLNPPPPIKFHENLSKEIQVVHAEGQTDR
jgi:hypothetical protein